MYRTGKIVTLCGTEIPVDSRMAYKGVNYMDQGTAAEILKLAMLALADFPVILPVHDELIFEYRIPPRKRDILCIKEVMERIGKEALEVVDTPVSLGRVTTNWGEVDESFMEKSDDNNL